MLIKIPIFRGEVPIISDRSLPVECAQIAVNTDLSQGILKAFYRTHSAKTLNTTAWRSIFPIKARGEIFWVCSEEEANFANTPVYVSQQRFYYADGMQGKESNYTLISNGGALSYGEPNTYYKLGVPKPGSTLLVTIKGDGNEVITDSVSYIYTYVTEWGYEGEPSDPTDVYDIEEGQYIELGNFGIPVPGDYNIVGVRIYRTSTGSSETDFLFISEIMGSECPDYITPDEIIDNGDLWYDQISTLKNTIITEDDKEITTELGVSFITTLYSGLTKASDLGEAITCENYIEPPATIKGLFALSNGVAVGYRDKEIYLSEPFIHYGFPFDYRVLANFSIKDIGYYGTTIIAGTEGNPYKISGYDPQAVSMERLPDKQACLFTRAMVSGSSFVLYPSPDGLYMISDLENRNITDKVFTKEQWHDLLTDKASYDKDIIAFLYDGKYHAFFEGTNNGFIVELDSGLPFYTLFSIESDYAVYGGYVDLIDDTLYLLVKNGSTYYIRKWEGGRTKEISKDIISEAGSSITAETENNLFTTGVAVVLNNLLTSEADDNITTETGNSLSTGAIAVLNNFLYQWKSKIFVTSGHGYFSCMKIIGDFIDNIIGAGTLLTVGTAVTGTGTSFTTELEAGYVLYDATLKEYREIASVESDTAMTLVSAFSSDLSEITCYEDEIGDYYEDESGGYYEIISPIAFKYNKVMLNIYKDDSLFFTRGLNSTKPFRIPSGLGQEWEIEVKGVKETYPPIKMAQSMEELYDYQ